MTAEAATVTDITPLAIGEIVQIRPDACHGAGWFGGCLMVVTEPKPWGAQGYVKNAGSDGLAFIRVRFEDIARTGGSVAFIREDGSL